MVAQILQWNMVVMVQKIAGRSKNNIRRLDKIDKEHSAVDVLS